MRTLMRLAQWVVPALALFFTYQVGARSQSRIMIPQGTAERPSLYFQFNDRTGLYAKDAVTLGFSVDGEEVLTLGRDALGTRTSEQRQNRIPIESTTYSDWALTNGGAIGEGNTARMFLLSGINSTGGSSPVYRGANIWTVGDVAADGTHRFHVNEPPEAAVGGAGASLVLFGMTDPGSINIERSILTLATQCCEGNFGPFTGGRVYGLRLSGSAELADADLFRSGVFINGFQHAGITMHAATTAYNMPNPPTNTVSAYIDESTDRGAGTATADCALVYRKADGSEVVGTILTTDGGC